MRITSQLIEAATEHHLWAEKYDRDLDDIFAIQDEITRNIVVALQIKLTIGPIAEYLAKGTRSLEAWERHMLGRQHFQRFTAEDNIIARGLFEEAFEIDPNYLVAGVLVGWTYLYEAKSTQSTDPKLPLELAERQVSSIRETKAGRNMGGCLLANIHFTRGEYDEAVRVGRIAMAFAPGPGDRASFGEILLYVGESAEAIAELNTAIRLSPVHWSWYLGALALAHAWNGDWPKAIEIGQRYLSREPDRPYAYAHLALIYSIVGRDDEAKQIVKDLSAKFPAYRLRKYTKKQPYKDLKRKEYVHKSLREAGVPE